MVPLNHGKSGPNKNGFLLSSRWVFLFKLTEVIFTGFELCLAQFELKEDNPSWWRSDEEATAAHEVSLGRGSDETSNEAIHASIGAARTSY